MIAVGRSATMYLTLPLVGAGIAAAKTAMSFDAAFTRISAISNAAEKDIARWKGQVLSLAEATGRDPQELAEALYFLASAGLKAGQEMAVLRMAAKASAVGLGETADVARITSQALNAYADSGLTAKHAVDLLVAAVREGTADPDEFATALGRILPIAARAKVGFDEVVASLAALSNIGLDVNEGVTAMRGLIAALLAPGAQAKNTLKDLGLSADQVRQSIGEDGLVGVLELLNKATGGNIDKLKAIIPNIRALTGELGLTGENAEKVKSIFHAVANSTGSMAKAFKETEESAAFKFQQSLARLKVVAIDLGNTLVPIFVRDIVPAIKSVAEWFGNLDEKEKGQLVKIALLAAALGPASMLIGGLTRLAGLAFRVAGGFAQMMTVSAGLPGMIGTVGARSAGAVAGVGGLASVLIGPFGLAAGLLAITRLAPGAASKLADFLKSASGQGNQQLGGALIDMVLGNMAPGYDTTDVVAFAKDFNEFRDLFREGKVEAEQFARNFQLLGAAILGAGGTVADVRKEFGALTTQEAEAIAFALEAKGSFEALASVVGDNVANAIKTSSGDLRRWGYLLVGSRNLSVENADALAGLLLKLERYDGELSTSEQRQLAQMVAAGRVKAAKKLLRDEIALAREALSKENAELLQTVNLMNTLAGMGPITLRIYAQTTPLVVPRGGDLSDVEAGGILRAQAGLIARGPTVLVGEGSKPTFAGQGTEAVLPLDSRGIGILAEALRRAQEGGPGAAPVQFTFINRGHIYGVDGLEQVVEGFVVRAWAKATRR
jgi:TP901 family phage tail tape measure protein